MLLLLLLFDIQLKSKSKTNLSISFFRSFVLVILTYRTYIVCSHSNERKKNISQNRKRIVTMIIVVYMLYECFFLFGKIKIETTTFYFVVFFVFSDAVYTSQKQTKKDVQS